MEQATNSIHFLGIFLPRGKVISRSRLVIHPFTSLRIVSIRAARCSAHSYTGWIRVICAWDVDSYPMDISTTHVYTSPLLKYLSRTVNFLVTTTGQTNKYFSTPIRRNRAKLSSFARFEMYASDRLFLYYVRYVNIIFLFLENSVSIESQRNESIHLV